MLNELISKMHTFLVGGEMPPEEGKKSQELTSDDQSKTSKTDSDMGDSNPI